MKNALGIALPDQIPGYGVVTPYSGVFTRLAPRANVGGRAKPRTPDEDKVLPNLKTAILRSGLKDGMTVSFHHHLRNGDQVVNQVMQVIAELGLKDLCVAASGIFAVHEPLVKLIEAGVITQIITSTFNSGPVPKAITAGKLKKPLYHDDTRRTASSDHERKPPH